MPTPQKLSRFVVIFSNRSFLKFATQYFPTPYSLLPVLIMDAFAPLAPEWTNKAIHAYKFCCPSCSSSSLEAEKVWLNRRSPVLTEDRRRKWQEFYSCHCGCVWWAWSSDRRPKDISNQADYNPT